jgi:hypothetical protein
MSRLNGRMGRSAMNLYTQSHEMILWCVQSMRKTMDYWIQMDGNVLVSLSSIWDAIPFIDYHLSNLS